MERGYSVDIKECSRQLSAKERINMKDTTSALSLDELTQEGDVNIKVKDYAVLSVHNEKSDNKDYEQYILIDEMGVKYVTSSDAFFNSFMDIYTEMEGEEEEWSIRVYRSPSKNYKGKDFITCQIQ